MKKFLLFCLFSFITLCSIAQTGRDCLYRIKFYNWQWDYCKHIGYDTVAEYSKATGEVIGDTIFLDTAYQAFSHSDLTIGFPLPGSFVDSERQMTVTSIDGRKNFEVVNFELQYFSDNAHSIKIDGARATAGDLRKLKKLATTNNPYGIIWIKVKLKDLSTPLDLGDAPIMPLINVIEKPAGKH